MRRPVLPLLKALPGLVQSGCLWHTFADEAAASNAWRRIEDVADDIYVKEPGPHPLLLAMYVDDMLIGGPGPTLQSELDALDRAKQKDQEIGFDIGQVGPLTKYLGCDYRRERHENGTVTVSVSQRDYIVTLVGAFLERSGKPSFGK